MAEKKTRSGTAADTSPSQNEGGQQLHSRQPGDDAESSPGEWYSVVFSLPWIVRGAKTGQDAINIAVSEVGGRITSCGSRIRNADISIQQLDCNDCGTRTDALLVVSETALVGLRLEIEVQSNSLEGAEKTARHEIGPYLDDTPLTTGTPDISG